MIMVTAQDFPMTTMYGSDFRPCLAEMFNNISAINAWERDLFSERISSQLSNMSPDHSGRTFRVALLIMTAIQEAGSLEAYRAKVDLDSLYYT